MIFLHFSNLSLSVSLSHTQCWNAIIKTENRNSLVRQWKQVPVWNADNDTSRKKNSWLNFLMSFGQTGYISYPSYRNVMRIRNQNPKHHLELSFKGINLKQQNGILRFPFVLNSSFRYFHFFIYNCNRSIIFSKEPIKENFPFLLSVQIFYWLVRPKPQNHKAFKWWNGSEPTNLVNFSRGTINNWRLMSIWWWIPNWRSKSCIINSFLYLMIF